jgi:hypothetical protein
MLLLSGVSREDGELVELYAVLKKQPGMYARAMVWLAVHANPRILGMQFMDNLVTLSLQLANDNATEQFVRRPSFSNRKTPLGREDLLVLEKLLLSLPFLGLCLVIRGFKKWLHFSSNFNQSLKCCPNVLFHPYLLDDVKDGNDVDKVFLVVPVSKSGHLRAGAIRHLDLDLLGFPFLVQIYRGDIQDRGLGYQLPLLAFGVLQAFQRGLEVGTHGVLPEWSLQNNMLEGQLGLDL